MRYSLTQGSILFAVLGTVLVQIGFSTDCSNEILTYLPGAIGAIGAWIGRMRAGGTNILGFKK